MQDSLDIALVRVDNRLVHGQILEAWVPFLKASCIVVADDQVASDFFRETVIRMAVPSEVEVVISGVAEFAENKAFRRGCGPKTIVLFSTVSAAWTAYRLGFRFDKLNIGNIYNEECRLCCTPSVQMNDGDIRDITGLRNAGVQIELRRVPREKPIDLFEIVRSMGP
ncbi:MAG: PTS sorbose transporter subunit IIC [Syntrophobacterales bacterium CG03_land_8_20_14_0_80_58_14]|nr:MAG: PTS sorbose transporter subunit IIC [Syntrophobacterales bacterium CG03_land_8_20_14_0_80_58_14]